MTGIVSIVFAYNLSFYALLHNFFAIVGQVSLTSKTAMLLTLGTMTSVRLARAARAKEATPFGIPLSQVLM